MTGFLLVRGARQLLTLRGSSAPRRGPALRDLGLIEDGAVLIRGGQIVSVGSTRRVENLTEARSAREIDATGRVVMPGFVDSHTHLVSAPARLADYEADLAGSKREQIDAGGGGALARARARRALSGSRLLLQARRSLRAFICHGTTTVEGKAGHGLDQTGELKTLRVMAALDQRPLDVLPTFMSGPVLPLEWANRGDDYVEWVCARLLPKIRRRKLARFVDVAWGPEGLSPEQARGVLETARARGFQIKMHAEQPSPSGAARLARELGAVSADHLVYADPEDILMLAASPTLVTLLPGASFHPDLGRFPPARAFIEAGAAVALATDFNPSRSSTHSMQMVMGLACAQMRMTPAEAVAAATINGAHALGVADRVGSLEAGKQADLILLDVPDYRELTYHVGGNLVAMTLKRGQILCQQGEVQWPDD